MKYYTVLILIFLADISEAQHTRIWSTYYGGPGNECNPVGGPYVATDNQGNIFFAGYTASTSGIAAGGFQNSFGGAIDAFLVKFDSSGNRLWATYYGNSGAEYIYGLTTDISGNVYIAGRTSSVNGISSAGFQNSFGGGTFDAFLVKFDSSGNRLWATYYGGTEDDGGEGITTDINGNIYLTGATTSPSNISSGGFQNSFGGSADAFLIKFDSSGNRIWATYYGGSSGEGATGSAVDESGNIYLCGGANSVSGIASGGFQNSIGGGVDAFLVKFDSSGNRIWATYYGGSSSDKVTSILTSASGKVYIAGYSNSTSGISFNGFQNNFAGGNTLGDGFLVKFDESGNRIWGTYYGGIAEDYCLGIAKDISDNIYMAGDSYSSSGIASNGFQNNLQGIENEFLVKLDSNGNRLCSTYFGALHEEDGRVAVDLNSNIYLVGSAQSTTGITFGGFQNTFGGGGTDAYLVRFSSTCQVDYVPENLESSIIISPNPASVSFNIQINSQIHDGQLILVNTIGQKVHKQKIIQGMNEIKTDWLSRGLYNYIILQDNITIKNGKVLVQ